MNLILLGLPGVGKGTQAKRISQEYNIHHISTGDIFRRLINDKTPLGIKVKEYINAGELVPDEDTIALVQRVLYEEKTATGFVFDGFPRTVNQAKALKLMLAKMNNKLDLVLYIKIDEAEIIRRLSGRRVCLNCGSSYNLVFNPPKRTGICNKCGGKLLQRKDDEENTIKNRIEKNKVQINKLTSFYSQQGILKILYSEGSIEEVFTKIKKEIEVYKI